MFRDRALLSKITKTHTHAHTGHDVALDKAILHVGRETDVAAEVK